MSGTNPRRPPQFCPGLAAFTDAIEALPQETIRHFTLLREVDAKASGPEDLLRSFIKQTLSPPFETDPNSDPVRLLGDLTHPDDSPSNIPDDGLSDEHAKRSRLHQVRILISDLLLTLDEKIHVISTASEALAKHQVRIDDAYHATTIEIDPVLRDGNPAHWAYGNSILEGSFNQRPGANENVSTVYPAEPDLNIVSSRTDGRREGTSRRYAHAPEQLESKITNHTESATLPFENSSSVPATKRRKGATQGNQPNKTLALERSATQIRSGAHPGSQAPQTAKSQPVTKVQAPHNPTSNTKQSNSRKRAPVPPAAAALSPTKPNFVDSRSAGGPPQLSENFVKTASESVRKDAGNRNSRPKPASAKSEAPRALPKIDGHVKQEDKISLFESKVAPAPKPQQDKLPQSGNEGAIDSAKDMSNRKDEPTEPQEDPPTISKDTTKNDQRLTLDDEPPAVADKLSRSTEVPEKVGGRVTNALAVKSAPKPSLVSDTSKSSQTTLHKPVSNKPSKSNGDLQVQTDDRSTLKDSRDDYDDDDDDDAEGDVDVDDAEGDVDADEMRYCYCNQVSYGKMVACDGPGCQREWFHLPCVGLSHMPNSKDKWYCKECRASIQNHPKTTKTSQHRA
ncbi:hypothetical protein TWF481_007205 [Arthrobotrys musiformis]|uniref:Chromatin modification-related protein n=1 Tax=Arthrobotrys musiformis TaxID=47236 RepID=A0AAV9WAS2_9PEZI